VKSKIQATVVQGYDAITPICHFNNIAGNHRTKRSLDHPSIKLQTNLIQEEMDELRQAYLEGDEVGVADALADLTVVVGGMLHKMGLNPNDVMKAVNNANLSKFCSTPEEAQESVDTYRDDARYTDVHYVEEEPNVFVIKGRLAIHPDGDLKILKSVYFQPPEESLKQLLENR